MLSTAFRFRGTIAADRGDFPLSRTWFEQALALDAGDGRERGACEARLGLIRAYVAEHDFESAERELGTLLDVAEARSLANIRLEGLRQRARLLREQGRGAEVVELLRRAADEARTQANERMLARFAADLADVYFDAGDANALANWVGVALEAQPAQGYVRLAEAQLALLRHERARAERLLDEAAALLGERLSDKQQALRARLTAV
jgi:tetratricopeptide (TPR) repeat protein